MGGANAGRGGRAPRVSQLAIEWLRKALLSGNAAALLRADNNEARAEGRAVRAAMAPAALSPVLRPHTSLAHTAVQ